MRNIMREKNTENYVRFLVSRNLKRLRGLQNMSQLGLASEAGITHNFINDIENSKKGVSARTIAKLSVALNVEPHQFFLPDDMSNNKMLVYVNDFNDSMQKVIKGLTEQYLPAERKEIT